MGTDLEFLAFFEEDLRGVWGDLTGVDSGAF
jgi:hypothetical protein